MIIMIDGPQGAGKTTIVNNILQQHDNVHHRKFGPSVFMQDTILADAISGDNYLYERGIISYAIYSMLWNSCVHVKQHTNGNDMLDWEPVRLEQFQQTLQLIDKLYIFYADNPDELLQRIDKREKTTGRIISSMERNVVAYSNALFKGYSEMLQLIAPEKVQQIELHDIPAITSQIIKHAFTV